MKFNLAILAITALLVVTSFSLASALPQAVIRIAPEQPCWVPNGITQYKVNVYAANVELNPQTTQAIQYRVVRPQGIAPTNISFVNAASGLSQSTDFFSGYNSSLNMISSSWTSSQIRGVFGSGPSNRNGLLASYWFTISPGTPYGQYAFNLSHINFAYNQNTSQDYRIESVPFKLGPKPQLCESLMSNRAR